MLPETVFCSSAERATATALLAVKEFPIDLEPQTRDDLYNADANTIIALLSGRSESKIMVVGHNPGMEDLLARFSESPCHLSPGTCVRLDFSVSLWEELFGPVQAIKSSFFLPP
jgi:phosphohistidine phosphatase